MQIHAKDRDFRLIHAGWFREDNVVIELVAGERYFSPDVEELIEEAWLEARLDPYLDLYNGKALSMIASSVTKGILKVQTMRTDYRSFYGTNVRNFSRINDPRLCANALAVCAVVESRDGNILIGRRSAKVAESSGFWHVPGGTMEVSPELNIYANALKLRSRNLLNPFRQMERELEEEFGLRLMDIGWSVCLALGENLRIGKPEFICYYHLNIDSVDVQKRIETATNRDEHDEILHLPMEEIESFVQSYEVAPIGKAALHCYMHYLQSHHAP
jgi:8-oxo-dGTP pyrophosphatase MutT (NUDIX family)